MRRNLVATNRGQALVNFFMPKCCSDFVQCQRGRTGACEFAFHRLTAMCDIDFKILLPKPCPRLGQSAMARQKAQLRIDPVA